MALLASILALALPQEEPLEKRIHTLVEQLQSDEIQAVDDAVTGLVALGMPAIGPLREELRKASGDAKLRLEEAVRLIERNARRGRAVGAPVLVTLHAEEMPLGQALEELRKGSGQPLVWKDLPPGKVSLSLDKTPFWEALDRLCKAQGGIMWTVEDKEIVISNKAYRDLPKVFHGNQVVFFTAVSSNRRRYGAQVMPLTALEGSVAWVQGAFIPDSDLRVDEFKDDQGTNLAPPSQGGAVFRLGPEESLNPACLARPLGFGQAVSIHDDAKALARLKGEVLLEYTLDVKRLALFEKPQGSVGKSIREGMVTVLLKSFQLEEGTASIRVLITTPKARGKLPLKAAGFRLLDPQGKICEASGWVDDEADDDTGKIEYDASLDFTFPEGKFEVASLEITVPTELESISIPFDFRDIPLR
jgi:hypothetical protein